MVNHTRYSILVFSYSQNKWFMTKKKKHSEWSGALRGKKYVEFIS